MQIIREFFSPNHPYRFYHSRQRFRSGESKTVLLFPRKRSHNAYLYTMQVIDHSSTMLKRNEKPEVHEFRDFEFYPVSVSSRRSVPQMRKSLRAYWSAFLLHTRISNITHNVLLRYSLPLTVHVGWKRISRNEEILDVREKYAFITNARGKVFALLKMTISWIIYFSRYFKLELFTLFIINTLQ